MIRLSGRLRSSLIIGGQGIRARKLRTFLSMISLFLGVLAVVAVQAGSEVAQRALLADIELNTGKDGTLQMYLPSDAKVAPIALDTVHGKQNAVALSQQRAVIGEPGVTPINDGGRPFDQLGGGGGGSYYSYCDDNGYCSSGPQTSTVKLPKGQAIELQLTSMTGDVRQFRPFRQISGQWLDFAPMPSLAPKIVLNKKAAVGFEQYKVPAQMHVDGADNDSTPQIIGVVDDGGYEPAAYVRYDEMQNWLPKTAAKNDRGRGMQVMLSPGATDVEQVLRSRISAAGVDASQLHVNTVNSKDRLSTQLSLMRWIFLGMAALVLLIGVAGILNVGLATVGERIEEFALRRAVGTPRMLLAGIVLAETLLTGLLTAAAAVGTAAVAMKVAGAVLGGRFAAIQDLGFPWQAGAAGVIAGLVAGVLGGLIPAIRAARIPISTVMRA